MTLLEYNNVGNNKHLHIRIIEIYNTYVVSERNLRGVTPF